MSNKNLSPEKEAMAFIVEKAQMNLIREVSGLRRIQGIRTPDGRSMSISGVLREIIDKAMPELERELESAGLKKQQSA